MKKLTRTIASISLSLFAIGAMAQSQSNAVIIKNQEKVNPNPVVGMPSAHSRGVTTNPPMEAYMDYTNADANAIAQYGGTQTTWITDYCNHYYTIQDTNPHLALPNYNDLNSVTVAFDTLYDSYTQAGYVAQPGSVTLDTIATALQYHNVSGHNDTLIFWICEVDAHGLPTEHVLGSDTQIFTPANNHYDTTYIYTFPLGKDSVIMPANAREGWNFCITADYRNADQQDTFGIIHTSPSTNCASGGIYCDSTTVMGVKCGPLPAVNSWALGYYRYNTVAYGGNGNGASLYWPDTSGASIGERTTNNGNAIIRTPCPGYSSYYSNEQDWEIKAIVKFNNITGINNISASGLSVGQNYPNPFNKQTQIMYSLTNSSTVTFTVYDITGRVIMANDYGTVSAGQHEINLSANSFSPGIYFYTFNVNGNTVTKKMVITE